MKTFAIRDSHFSTRHSGWHILFFVFSFQKSCLLSLSPHPPIWKFDVHFKWFLQASLLPSLPAKSPSASFLHRFDNRVQILCLHSDFSSFLRWMLSSFQVDEHALSFVCISFAFVKKVDDDFNLLQTDSQDFFGNISCKILEFHQWLLLGTYTPCWYSEISVVSEGVDLPTNQRKSACGLPYKI